jgi:hypothetical protein
VTIADYQARLLAAFRLERGDLEENRRGRISPRQKRNLLRSGSSTLAGAFLIGGLLGLVMYGVAKKPLTVTQCAVAAALFLGTVVLGLRSFRRTRQDVALGIARHLSGPVTVRASRGGMRLSIQGEVYRLPVRPLNVQSGLSHHVYLAPRSQVIVAVEPTVAWGEANESG